MSADEETAEEIATYRREREKRWTSEERFTCPLCGEKVGREVERVREEDRIARSIFAHQDELVAEQAVCACDT